MLIRTYAVSKVTLHSQKEGNDSKIIKTAKKYWQLYLMLLLPLTLVFIFNYIPMYGTILAFKDYKISQLSGIFGTKSITTMGQIMKEDHYI